MRYCDKHIMIVLMLLLVPIYLISCSGNATPSLPSDNVTEVAKPGQPTGLTAVGADSRATISWTPQSGSTIYNLYWDTQAGVTTNSRHIHNVYIPFDHRDLTNGQTYYYRVSAQNVTGESDLSVEVQATPMLPFTKILTKLTDPDAEVGDEFGYSVAIDGNYAIVGAWLSEAGLDTDNPIFDAGAAYIFHRSDTGQWDPAGVKLTASDATPWTRFGFRVSISGDYAIVGAPNHDWEGAAYIFHRIVNSGNTNSWDAGTQIAVPPGTIVTGQDKFGSGVSISGDYAVVGDEGRSMVFVYHRTGADTWDNGTMLPLPPDWEADSQFGSSVAISGDYVIVGAQYEDGNAENTMINVGAAYIFHRRSINGMDDWTQFSKIMPHDMTLGDRFGAAVAISGDYAIVGAPREGDAAPYAGAAYIFHRVDENFWDEGPKIMAPDHQAEDFFGTTVAITEKYALVGAYEEDCGWDENQGEGSAYMYRRIGANTWDSGTKITIPEGDIGDNFGYAVAISGESAIIGALGDDGSTNGVLEAGAVYVY